MTKPKSSLNAFQAFEELRPTVLIWENKLRGFLPRCYAVIGDVNKAAAEFITMAQNFAEIAQNGTRYQEADETKTHNNYTQAIHIIENIG